MQAKYGRNAVALVVGLAFCILAARTAAQEAIRPLFRFQIHDDGDALIIPICLGDKKLQVLVDTGTNRSIFDRSLKDELGKRLGVAKLQTPAGPSEIDVFGPQQLRVGDKQVSTEGPVGCLDLGGMRETLGHQFMGVLGIDILRQYIVFLDFDGGWIEFFDKLPETRGMRLPMLPKGGLPAIDISVSPSRGPATFIVDTGAIGVTGRISADIFQDLVKAKVMLPEGKVGIVSSARMEIAAIGRLKTFCLGDYEYRDQVFEEGAGSRIGLEFISRHNTVLDFANGNIFLVRSKWFNRKDLRDVSGIRLARRDTHIIVMSVAESSPGEIAGIKPGDELERINGRPAKDTRLFLIRRLFCQTGDIDLELARNGKIIKTAMILSK